MEDQILAILLDMQKNMKSMDGRLDQLNQDVTGLKADVSGLKAGQEILQQDITSLKEGQLKINIKLEHDIGKKLSALFDGHALDTEKINYISETVESINNSYAATDIVTGINTAEINKLKSKIG